MTNREYEKYRELILGYHEDINELYRNVRSAGGISKYIRGGGFACYIDTAEEDLRQVYGDEFKESVYYNKDGSYKYKNGETYLWTVYCWKLQQAIEKMFKEATTLNKEQSKELKRLIKEITKGE